MTCYFDASTGKVYDYTGSQVGSLDGTGWGQSWTGDFPREVLNVLQDAMQETAPSAYNQVLLAEMASENIEEGTPP